MQLTVRNLPYNQEMFDVYNRILHMIKYAPAARWTFWSVCICGARMYAKCINYYISDNASLWRYNGRERCHLASP